MTTQTISNYYTRIRYWLGHWMFCMLLEDNQLTA